MRTNIDTGIEYDGAVTIKLTNNGVVSRSLTMHNAGLKRLWTVLAKAIAGYNIQNESPKFIDIANISKINDEYRFVSCLKDKLKISGAIYGDLVNTDTQSTSVKFTTVFTNNHRRSKISPFSPGFVMYNSEGPMAVVVGSSYDAELATMINSVDSQTNMVIEWVMTFKNGASAEEG